MNLVNLLSPLVALLMAPGVLGIINRTKAVVAGRKGQPLLQPYFDLVRLMRKGMVYSETTSWVFRIAPAVIFSAMLCATLFIPIAKSSNVFSFHGDLLVFVYLMALARFFLIISALDTGSAFEGMGASREAFYSALAEPVLFVCLFTIMRVNNSLSLSDALSASSGINATTIVLTSVPLFIILLAENSRIPFDDPNTHLELTMIHEVMILDNSGSDLALMEYASAIKLWLFALISAHILIPVTGLHPLTYMVILLGIIVLIAICIGVVESIMARQRLLKIPQLLFGAGVTAVLGYFLNIANMFGL